MIKQDDIVTILKDIEKDTNDFKSAQPFFNGQYGMKLIENNNVYDTTVTIQNYSPIISGNFKYVSNTQINPFCTIIAVILLNGTPFSISQSYQQAAYRLPSVNNKEVNYHFKFSVNLTIGTVVQVKAYAIASDFGTLTPQLWTQ